MLGGIQTFDQTGDETLAGAAPPPAGVPFSPSCIEEAHNLNRFFAGSRAGGIHTSRHGLEGRNPDRLNFPSECQAFGRRETDP
jgi:hypothetical protein